MANVPKAVKQNTKLIVNTAANTIQEPKCTTSTKRNLIMNDSAVKLLPEPNTERGIYEFTSYRHTRGPA